jgi:hypothetical protein
MNVLVVDVGGTHVKLLATGQSEPRKFASGPTLTVEQMVAGVKEGLGTGLGSTMIVEDIVERMELGQLPYRKGIPR